MRRHPAIGLTALLATLFSGCGLSGSPPSKEPDAQRRVALNDVGELYRTYQLAAKKPPKSAKDLERVEMGGPIGMASITGKDVVVRWEATLPDLGEEPGKVASDQVLAYEKEVPNSGGLVLMLDRTIRTMTADQFKAAGKAGRD